MAIEFRCQNCGCLLQVPEETAGQEAQCAGCGHRQPIPGQSEPGPASLPPLPKPFANNPLVAERVQAPALALMIWGILGGLLPLVQLFAHAVRISLFPPLTWSRFPLLPMAAGGQVMVSLPAIAISALVFFGGWSMYRLERRRWAMAGAIVALIPCFSPCCLVGIPLGIWALTVLSEPPVQGAFRS